MNDEVNLLPLNSINGAYFTGALACALEPNSSGVYIYIFIYISREREREGHIRVLLGKRSCELRIMEDTIILYPSPGRGHLISMIELGKLIHKHHPSFSITVIIVATPNDTASTAPYINHISATTSSITFHYLPPISPPPHPISSPSNQLNLSYQIPHLNNPNLHQALLTLSQSTNIKAFFIDFFCNAAFQVSTNLNIPTYYFFTSGAHGLATLLYVPTIHRTTTKSLKDLDVEFHIPGLPCIRSSDMPMTIMDRSNQIYESFLETANTMPKSAGIVVNTFELLEERAIRAISDGPTPPIFCVGPVISTHDEGSGDDKHECLSWLDSQPSRSVVFLSFGSRGLFPADQLKEMATGLERSGVRFLWVVRNPPADGVEGRNLATVEPSLDSLLPQGFLDRTNDRGYVVRSWAPQVAVLNHDSVGGFVTHCGWNSILESVCAGVPMVAWPLYAEQKMNRVALVEEMKVALKLKESENGLVKASELEERVRELMESEKGMAVRDRVVALRDGAIAAISEGGTSRVALSKLAELLKRG